MTQPSFVPIGEADQVRDALRLSPPPDWRQSRVAELVTPGRPRGRGFGTPGPDQGYALLVAEQLFTDRIEVTPGESVADALHGAAALGTARAALFGRAPVAKDVEVGLLLFGFLGGAPEDLVEWRRPRFQGAAHHEDVRLAIVDQVSESTLRLSPQAVRSGLTRWRELVQVSS